MATKRTCSKTGKGLKKKFTHWQTPQKIGRSYDRNKKTLKKENGKEYRFL